MRVHSGKYRWNAVSAVPTAQLEAIEQSIIEVPSITYLIMLHREADKLPSRTTVSSSIVHRRGQSSMNQKQARSSNRIGDEQLEGDKSVNGKSRYDVNVRADRES
jgi:hypothetical protein